MKKPKQQAVKKEATAANNGKEKRENKKEKTVGGGSVEKKRWRNKQRVLLISSRGVSYLARHLLDNLKCMLPHARTDSKFNRKHGLGELAEIAEMRNCNKCIYLEMHKRQDAYVWLSAQPHGPSVKFLLENVHTMQELKLTGNCLKGSRPLLAFDSQHFDADPHYPLIKELLVQIFSTPNFHPKSQPFIDHVLNFTVLDNKIWVRNYQIGDELAEIGPRFVLNPIKIFDSCFRGAVLYENPHYVPPVVNRKLVKERASMRYQNRVAQRLSQDQRRPSGDTYMVDPTNDIFKI